MPLSLQFQCRTPHAHRKAAARKKKMSAAANDAHPKVLCFCVLSFKRYPWKYTAFFTASANRCTPGTTCCSSGFE